MAPKATPSKDSQPAKQGFQPLAFEPKAKGKAKTKAETPKTAKKAVPLPKGKSQPKGPSKSKSAQGIPEVVSRRMAQRMALFCGIPTLLGLATFPTSYFMVQKGIELPNVAVLLASMGFFGL
ncbi:MAG: PAM68 family protein, partial [Thermosynechococcaceae cyanobacterium]